MMDQHGTAARSLGLSREAVESFSVKLRQFLASLPQPERQMLDAIAHAADQVSPQGEREDVSGFGLQAGRAAERAVIREVCQVFDRELRG